MSPKMALYPAMLTIFWIYPTISAPMPEDENSIIMEENSTSSCFRDILPMHLQMHYDRCMRNNLSEESIMNESDILSCVIEAAGAMSSEEKIDISKLDIVLEGGAAEGEEPKPVEDPTFFSESVQKCSGDDDVKMPEDFVQCLFEALSMGCTNSTEVEEASSVSETEEEMM